MANKSQNLADYLRDFNAWAKEKAGVAVQGLTFYPNSWVVGDNGLRRPQIPEWFPKGCK